MIKILSILAALFLASSNSLNAQINLQSGLIARYGLDGNGQDISGNNNNGTVLRAFPTTDRFGRANRAMRFYDSAKSNIKATVAGIPLGTSDRAINLWAKWSTKAFTNAAHVANWGQATGNGTAFGIMVYKDNKWFGYGNNYPAGFDLSSNTVADAGWHMITCMYVTGKMVVYIDGIKKAEEPIALNTLAGQFVIGGRMDTSGDSFYDGVIDDIRIYNRALTIDEITALQTETSLGVANTPNRSPLTIFPNPASKTLFVNEDIDNAAILIQDVSGRTLTNIQINGRSLDVSKLPAGVYFIILKKGTDVKMARFIKE